MAKKRSPEKKKAGVTNTGQLRYGLPLSDDDLMRYFHECYHNSVSWFDPIKLDTEKLLDMYAGETLSQQDQLYLAETYRPPVSFNFALATLNTISGMNEQKDAVYKGQDMSPGEDTVGDWITSIVRQEMVRCQAHDHDDSALQSMLITGYGFTEHYLDTSRIPIHVIRKGIPFHEIWPDPDAVETNLADARFIIHERQWLLEEVEARWPDRAEDLQTGLGATGGINLKGADTMPIGAGSSRTATSRSSPSSRSRIYIYRLLYYRLVPRVYYIDPETGDEVDETHDDMLERHKELQGFEEDGGIHPITGQPIGQVQQFPEGIPPSARHPYTGKRYYQAYIATGSAAANKGSHNGGLVLSHEELSVRMFPIRALTGFKWIKAKDRRVQFFGIGRAIWQPQNYVNRVASVELDILTRGAKGGGYFEADVPLGSPEKFVSDQSTPGHWTAVSPGSLTPQPKIVPKPVVSIPEGPHDFMQFCIGLIGQISLVSNQLELSPAGSGANPPSNVALSSLQEKSLQGLGALFRNYSLFLEDEGRVAAALALMYLPAVEIDRMLGDLPQIPGLTAKQQPATDPQTGQPQMDDQGQPQMETVPITVPDEDNEGQERPIKASDILKIKDPFDYDVTVDTETASPTRKLAAFNSFIITDLAGTLVKQGFGNLVIPMLMRIAPLPENMGNELADQMEQQIQQQQAGPSPQDIVKFLQSTGPDGVQQLLDKAGIKLPTKMKAPAETVNYKDVAATDPDAARAMLVQAGLITPEQAAAMGSPGPALPGSAAPMPQQAPPPNGAPPGAPQGPPPA